MRNIPDTDEYYKLWWLFVETAFFFSKARNKELSKYDISLEQIGTLFCIKMLVSQKDLLKLRWKELLPISELERVIRY